MEAVTPTIKGSHNATRRFGEMRQQNFEKMQKKLANPFAEVEVFFGIQKIPLKPDKNLLRERQKMKMLGKQSMAVIAGVLALSFAYTAKCEDPTASRYENGQNRTQGPPMKYNKASGFIGMDINNQNGEHLGHITDIVFDLRSGRVSYVVMTTSSKATLGIDEKLLAVPLSAFTVSSDEKHLVLNADKSKVEAAQGFTRNNWPDVGNPAWGSQTFWKNP